MKKKKRNEAPRCPYCGSTTILRSADGIDLNNSKNTKLYVCKRYPACDAYVRVYPGTSISLGTLADSTASFTLDVYGHVTDQIKRDSAARMEQFIRSVNE